MGEHKSHMIQETSRMAYEDIRKELGERQKIVLEALEGLCGIYGDATDQEMKEYLNKRDPNYVRPRRFELVNKFKMVGFSQKRKCRITGKIALAWKVVREKNE